MGILYFGRLSTNAATSVWDCCGICVYTVVYSFVTPIALLYSLIFSTVIHIGFFIIVETLVKFHHELDLLRFRASP